MDNIRVNLGNGQWWDIKGIQTHGMRKAIKKAAQASLTESMRMQQENLAISVEVADMMLLTDEISEQTLIQCTAGWSWPEPVNKENIGKRDTWMIDLVLERMNDAYSRTPEQIKALEKNLPSPS